MVACALRLSERPQLNMMHTIALVLLLTGKDFEFRNRYVDPWSLREQSSSTWGNEALRGNAAGASLAIGGGVITSFFRLQIRPHRVR